MDFPCKVESGLQLFNRLGGRPRLDFIYPHLFKDGIKYNEVVEISSELNTSQSLLLYEMIANTLLPTNLGGSHAGVVYLLTDGHFRGEHLIKTLKKFIRVRNSSQLMNNSDEFEFYIETTVKECLKQFQLMTIFDSVQMFITIQGLEYILSEDTNISLVIIDTISAFYWTDRMFGSGILRMDMYIKKILKTLQSATKEYKSAIIYTRPGYFVSKLAFGESAETCTEGFTLERINYRISLKRKTDESEDNSNYAFVEASITNCQNTIIKNFVLKDEVICWL